MSSPSPQSPSREAIVAQLFELFRHSGFEGVSISDISVATSLGKSSLYHHFPGGKADMAAAVLDFAGAWLATEIIAPLRLKSTTREARIDSMLSALNRLYCAGDKPCILASMLIGQPDGEIERSVRGAFKLWIDALVTALTGTGLAPGEARKRATSAIIQIEGALVLSRALGDPAAFRQTLDSIRVMLLR